MAWNDSGNGKDPWKQDGQNANDLDKIVRDWQRKLRGMLGGGGGSSGGGSSGGGSSSSLIVLILLLLGVWAFFGVYTIDEAERGVVQRFGAYTETSMPGVHWHWPYPIETVDKVNIHTVSNFTYSNEILTADTQYVFVQMVVQYRRPDPVKYSFEVEEPEVTLHDVTESALREVVGTSTLESLVTSRRDEIAPRTRKILQATLNSYNAGIEVTTISLEKLYYPNSVQDAVDDTQKAGNDKDRFILEAKTYASDLIPKAHGAAARITEDAEAYRDRVVADAEGEASRFSALLAEYMKAPEVTRKRLYLEAVEDVYGRSNKVILDADASGNLLYLPLDKLLEQHKSDAAPDLTGSGNSTSNADKKPTADDDDASRTYRRTRQ